MMQRCSLTAAVAQRSFSRAFTMATSSVSRPASTLLFHQQQQVQAHARRSFGSSQPRLSSVVKELQDAIQDEIKAEQQMEENNLGGKTPPSINGFKVVTDGDGAEFRLIKTHGNEKILVSVNVNHSVNMEEEELEEDEMQQQEVEHEIQPKSLPEFQIEITKGEERLVFYMEMVKSETEEKEYDYQVGEFMIAPATKTDKFVNVPEEIYSSSGKYIDPQLHELLFIRYLEERGFTKQFLHELVEYATHYEHQQYVGLLEKLKKFIGK